MNDAPRNLSPPDTLSAPVKLRLARRGDRADLSCGGYGDGHEIPPRVYTSRCRIPRCCARSATTRQDVRGSDGEPRRPLRRGRLEHLERAVRPADAGRPRAVRRPDDVTRREGVRAWLRDVAVGVSARHAVIAQHGGHATSDAVRSASARVTRGDLPRRGGARRVGRHRRRHAEGVRPCAIGHGVLAGGEGLGHALRRVDVARARDR